MEAFLKQRFCIVATEEVLTQLTPAIVNRPLVWRYLLEVDPQKCGGQSEDDYV